MQIVSLCNAVRLRQLGSAAVLQDMQSIVGPLSYVVQVLAVEPIPPIAGLLRHNLQRHGLSGSVYVIPRACGSQPGSATFTYYRQPHMPGNSTADPAEKAALQAPLMAAHLFDDTEVFTCPVTTVECLLREHRVVHVELLKIDVEGCEVSVLRGVGERCWRRIRQVVVEVHDVAARVRDVVLLLTGQGYVVQSQQAWPSCNVMVYATRPSACGDA